MSEQDRLHALDAVRALALLLGIALHAAVPYTPGLPKGIWAVVDASPSLVLADFSIIVHSFRMTLFFFVAGFFARLLLERRGFGGFSRNRLERILIPFIAGWIVLVPLTGAVWIVGLLREYGGVLPKPPASAPGALPLMHLWFLYYLMLFYLVVLALRAVFRALDRRGVLLPALDRITTASLNGCLASVLLAVPATVCLIGAPDWTFAKGIPTPDNNLIPALPAFIGYATAVAFGWFVHRQSEGLQLLQRRWRSHLVIALAATAAGFAFLTGQVPVTLVPPVAAKAICAFASGIAAWGWSFAIIGAAMKYFAGFSPMRRYLSDASYYMYLAHLPIVVAIAVWVGPWRLSWMIKYPLTLALAFLLLLVSYHYLVRATFIGRTLNGRRYAIGRQKLLQAAREVAAPGR